MSLLLVILSVVLVAAVYARIRARARAAIRAWAADYGYRVVSCRLEAILSREFEQEGEAADFVYRVPLVSSSGDRLTAYFLIWNLLYGRPKVVV